MKSIVLLSLFTFSIILFLNCSEPIEENQVPGIYLNLYNIDNDSIIINADGTFAHWYRDFKSTVHIDKGTWQYSRKLGISYITLSTFYSCRYFYIYDNNDYDIKESDTSFYKHINPRMEIFESSGTIKIRFGPDSVYDYYKRTNQ